MTDTAITLGFTVAYGLLLFVLWRAHKKRRDAYRAQYYKRLEEQQLDESGS